MADDDAARSRGVNLCAPLSRSLRRPVAGADGITVLPIHASARPARSFARRLARNTQLILIEEAYVAKVGDPSAGSGAIEDLTTALCEAAWKMFQEIEKAGGVWKALQSRPRSSSRSQPCAPSA